MFERTLFAEEHGIFRRSVAHFIDEHIVPHHPRWEKEGQVSREVWHEAGQHGLLCPTIPEQYGGAGTDFLFSVVILEELARAGTMGPGFSLHSDIVAPYLLHYGSEYLKATWLPKMAAGETIGAIAMTEPSAGSDLQNIRTTARRDGDEFIVSGQKVFITNGQLCDIVIAVCKTDPDAGASGTSLILVETDRPGFERGRNLDKIG